MNLNKKGFTLIELIVVITILTILATVGFVSYTYLIGNSRNSKVETEMSQLSKSIELGLTKGIDIYSFVLEEAENTLNNPYIAGTETLASSYKAGKVNYLAMDYKKDEYEGNIDYRIGITKKLGIKYEIAGFTEDSTLGKSAKIKGNFNSRTKFLTISKINLIINDKNIVLEKNNGIKVGDTITSSGGVSVTTTVKKIKSIDNFDDNIFFNDSIDSLTTHIFLKNDETLGLIMGIDENSNSGVVVDGGNVLPY